MKKTFSESFKNLWRNKFSSIGTILVLSMLMFIFNILLVIHISAQNEIKKLGEKIDLVLYLQENIEEKTGKEIETFTRNIPGVKKTAYISKGQALEEFLRAHPKTAEYYKKFNLENTLPGSIRITVENPDFYTRVKDTMNKSRYQKLFENLSEEKQNLTINGNIIRNVEDMSKMTRYLLFWIMAIFAAGAIIMIGNTISMSYYHRKMEVGIMRLIGAGQKFILGPYLLESIWISLAALLLSFIIFTSVTELEIGKQFDLLRRHIDFPYLKIFLLEIVAVVVLSIVTSFIAIKKHINNI